MGDLPTPDKVHGFCLFLLSSGQPIEGGEGGGGGVQPPRAPGATSGVGFMIGLIFIFLSRHLGIPLPLSRLAYHLQYFVMFYFIVAVAYDAVEVAQKILFTEQNVTSLSSAQNLSDLVNSSLITASKSNMKFHNRRWRLHDSPQLSNYSSNNTL